ncbi:MAG TPA: lysoplasmalogenase family protein [Clostridia bacterium]|nr:lysoplasmalogenase family protein [Clostridia bacterium]
MFFIFFALLAVAHLYACYFHLEKLRMATKPLLLLSLAAFYACAARPLSGFVLAALLCGLMGDVFLLWPDDYARFVSGAAVFSLGHVLYSFILFRNLIASGAAIPPWGVLIVAVPFAVAVALASLYVMPSIKKPFLRACMPGYFALVALVGTGAWLTLITASRTGADVFGAALLAMGGLLFFASDTILSIRLFRVKGGSMNFWVMLTYIAAQLCLCLGFICL